MVYVALTVCCTFVVKVEGEGLDPQNEDFSKKCFLVFLHYSTGLCMYFQKPKREQLNLDFVTVKISFENVNLNDN